MKKTFKTLLILAAYGSLLFVDACIGIDCNCPTVTEQYFDYYKLQVLADETAIDATYSNLKVEIIPDSIDFVAFQTPAFNFDLGLINKAYGCSCIEPGFNGDKYPISGINVYCDKAFNASIAAGENINYLFEISLYNEQTTLDVVSDFPTLYYYGNGIKINTTSIPDSIGNDWLYTFTIEITKENGEKISGKTEAISWY